ncbi:uncharacterized protein N0V89_011943 [Didymosphaeria variabile]|uniref:Uncharacterized protein n=1 Tax=Didymosphaeria variabile TaxID=1932322 RepID=A0A9W8XC77_9PLEO|nr:uncharacterized protein N0V89_011943 [Didymosphaeria variabile]KAJ4345808.1 hypothetical protein N0V89_011943 [Didymosphaeria variabile]
MEPWADGSYYLNMTWLKLKLNQITAMVAKQVDDFLVKNGACEECRKNVVRKGPKELARLLVDLKKAAEKELMERRKKSATKEEEVAAEQKELLEKQLAEGEVEEEELTVEQMELLDEQLAAAEKDVEANRDKILAELMAGRDVTEMPMDQAEFEVEFDAAWERVRRREEERGGAARNEVTGEEGTDGGRD